MTPTKTQYSAEVILHSEIPEPILPHVSEYRQRIINEAVRKLKAKKKA